MIFDFGGVIIDIDLQRTVDAFSKFLPVPVNHLPFLDLPVIHEFETGGIDEDEFYEKLTAALDIEMAMDEFISAWNALIIGIPNERIELLKELRNSHRTFLLSNTNPIHYRHVSEKVLDAIGTTEIDHFFEGAYYSHLIHHRKPAPSSFNYVLQKHDLVPEETILFDDNDENLESASQLGISAIKVTADNTIVDIFN